MADTGWLDGVRRWSVLGVTAIFLAVSQPLVAQDAPADTAPADTATTEAPAPAPEAEPELAVESEAAPVPTSGRTSEELLLELQDFVESHPTDYDEFVERHPNMGPLALPYVFRAVAQMWFFYAIILGIAYFPAAYVVSILLAPLRASATNAAIFAGIQTLYMLVTAAILFALSGTSPTVFSGIFGLLMFVQLGLLIFTTRTIYDINILRVLLFGVCGSIAHSLVAGVIGGIVGLFMQGAFAGMVVGPMADYSREVVVPRLQADIDELQPRYDEAATKLEQQKKAATDLEAKLAATKKKIADTEKAIEAKRNSPEIRYSGLGNLVDRGDLEKARAGYVAFGEANPNTPLGDAAQAQVDAIEQQLQQSAEAREEELAQAKARAAEAAANLRAKLKSGRITLPEVRRAVMGLSRQEVIDLLGKPTASATNRYIYRNVTVYDPIRKKGRVLVVVFLQGHVQGVNYGS